MPCSHTLLKINTVQKKITMCEKDDSLLHQEQVFYIKQRNKFIFNTNTQEKP